MIRYSELQSLPTERETFRRLLPVFSKEKRRFFSGGIYIAIQGGLHVAMAYLLGLLVERGLVPRDWSEAWRWCAAILLLQGVSLLFGYLGKKRLNQAATFSALELRKRLFAKLQKIPLSVYDREKTGDLLTRVTSDVQGLEIFFSEVLVRLGLTVVSFVAIVLSTFFIHPALAAVLWLGAIPPFLVAALTRRPLRRWNGKFAQHNAQANALFSEHARLLEAVQSYGKQDWSRQKVEIELRRLLQSAHALSRVSAVTGPSLQVLCYVPCLLVLGFGGSQVVAGGLALGLFVTYLRISQQIIHPIHTLAMETQNIQLVFTSAFRIAALLRLSEEEEAPEARSWGKLSGLVEFKNVAMAYREGERILDRFNLRVEPGEHVGIVGKTGSGKSSALLLLLKAYPRLEGEVLIDGVSIDQWKRSELRTQIGYVSQQVDLFSGTVRENLSMGAPWTLSELERASHETGLSEVLAKRKRSFESPVGDHGRRLSSGERQLIALTRIWLRNPALMILDEATAQLDLEYQGLVTRALSRVMRGRTCFMIAHRREALVDCHRVFVFKEGRLEEEALPLARSKESKEIRVGTSV